MERINIGDGVFLNYIDNSKFKTDYICLDFLTELNDRSASYNALLSRVLLRGTKKYPDQKKLNMALDDAYDLELSSDVSRIGEKHVLEISECILNDAYNIGSDSISEKAIELLYETCFCPLIENGGFKSEYLESEKNFAVDEISAQINSKSKYALLEMLKTMCKGERFASNPIGNKAVIRKIDPVGLYEYYKSLVLHAPIEIFCVGRFNKEKVTCAFKKMFSEIKREVISLPETLYKKKVIKVKEKEKTLDINQSHLVMGFRTGTKITDPDWFALSLYNAVLGGSLTSKLFTVIREKMSLCYTIFSQCDPVKGIMFVYAGIANDKKDVTVSETINQMKLIEEGKVTDEEFESARGYLINSLIGIRDNPANLPDWFLVRISENSSLTPEELIEELKKVTLDDVIRVSKKLKLDTVYFLTGKGE